ncbi:hypothetical protein WMY93_020393 [Mugilogobius chulae]|uniref:Uncharacterized protein n=1 Tax=Mugilogobius chulae TaxID=88201 RepID=A0AAW0NLX7_9GOBI
MKEEGERREEEEGGKQESVEKQCDSSNGETGRREEAREKARTKEERKYETGGRGKEAGDKEAGGIKKEGDKEVGEKMSRGFPADPSSNPGVGSGVRIRPKVAVNGLHMQPGQFGYEQVD